MAMTAEAQTAGSVLVVDDSPETLRFLTDALEEAGFTVFVASSGAEALEVTADKRPEVILMDAVMPGMDGFVTTRRIKADPRLAHLPVIFMTGLSDTEHVVTGLEAGGVDYLTKPIVADELVARIKVHAANARKARSISLALDAAGRALVGVNSDGELLWTTPQAEELVRAPGSVAPDVLPDVAGWLTGGNAMPLTITAPTGLKVQLTFNAQLGPDEYLLSIADASADASAVFRSRLSLTGREAEVLLWLTRGKSNKDIGEILGLSTRTVDKHLEQVYSKLGVENRISAAMIALRYLDRN